MTGRLEAVSSVAPAPAPVDSARHDWFLRDSNWHDVVWLFTPTNTLEHENLVRIRWDFPLPSGRRFTDRSFSALLEPAKTLLALIRTRSLTTGLPQRATTVAGYFSYLRVLVRWMDAEGYSRFGELDASAVLRFQRAIERRTTSTGLTLAPTTVQKYLDLLVYLHRFRAELGDGLAINPFPGQSTGAIAGVSDINRRSWPYTPEPIAIPLIHGAIGFLSACAVDLLRAREIYATIVSAAQRRGVTDEIWRKAAAHALRHITLDTAKGPQAIRSGADLALLLDVLYTACFVVISYLVGPRASEILQLRSGCLQLLAPSDSAGDAGLAAIVGAIFKRETYHGRPHQWVAPPPAVHAIAILEALSAPHRARSGRPELWLRAHGGHRFGATEWQRGCSAPLHVLTTHKMRCLLRRCSAWFDLPFHHGKPWRLSTHQGRKTFVRFAALRDRSALFALAQHLGHRERGITDRCYVGTDYLLNREIDAAILDQSVSAWEHMLSTSQLGGRAGAEILAKRPRFRGACMKQDLKRYARMLVDSGLTLGVCDWGFCVYRQEYSACLGSITGPNALRREPSTCASCRNFAVSTRHRAYWLEQARRHEALLSEPALPTQTLKIARERLNEALAMIRSIDTKWKTTRLGSPSTR
jgi:integrase